MTGLRDAGRGVGTLVLAAAAGLAAACGAGDRAPGGEGGDPAAGVEPVETERVWLTLHSGIETPRREVVRDAERWRSIWATAHETWNSVPPVPEVDFGADAVVVAAMGRRPTGGYDIMVEDVRRTEEGLTVEVLEVSPGRGCVVAQTITTPAVAVRMPAAGLEVSVETRKEARDCA